MGVWILLFAFIAWKVYEVLYFKSEKFITVKNRVQSYIANCNELNSHIEELKDTYLGIEQIDYGAATYADKSFWNYQRREFNKHKYAPNIYNCSRTVCDNARNQPFKYVCKYFGIKATEDNLERFEKILNNFEAAEQGKLLLQNEKENIVNSIRSEIPFFVRVRKKKLVEKLGFHQIDLSTAYFPRYIFKYISSGGNASLQCEVEMDIENLNRFVKYLSSVIKFRKSIAGQRALMTSTLRTKILARDGYACKKCGASVSREPNLLLEIDHIIPLSRGGLTTEDNLQILCWRCNRKKGAKLESEVNNE